MTTLCSCTAGLLLLVLLPIDGSGQAAGTVRIRREGTDSVVAIGQTVVGYKLSSGDVVERYQTGRATGKGAWIGASLGLGIGVTLGLTTEDESQCNLGDLPLCGVEDIGRVMTGAILGAGLGAGAGALVGSLFKRMGWSRIDPFDVPEAPVQVRLIPEPRRVALVLTLR